MLRKNYAIADGLLQLQGIAVSAEHAERGASFRDTNRRGWAGAEAVETLA